MFKNMLYSIKALITLANDEPLLINTNKGKGKGRGYSKRTLRTKGKHTKSLRSRANRRK